MLPGHRINRNRCVGPASNLLINKKSRHQMNKPSRYSLLGAATLAFALVATVAQAAPGHSTATCADAWASYNDFKSRTVMEPPSQYAFTIQGAAVRAACGKNALPVPAGSDRPPRHHIHRKHKSAQHLGGARVEHAQK